MCVAFGRRERMSETLMITPLLDRLTTDRKVKILSAYSGNATHYQSAWRNNPEDSSLNAAVGT
jgi:hypothetical protein